MQYTIPDEELILLDGRCCAETQSVIDEAKLRLDLRTLFAGLTDAEAKFITEVKATAEKERRLVFRTSYGSYCSLCGKSAGYVPHSRTSRYHRKGQPNYDKPKTFSGVDLYPGCVSIKNRFSLGCCADCWKKVKPSLQLALRNVQAEIPEGITDVKPAVKRHPVMKCTQCQWTGPESEMGLLRTLMGDGFYHGICPKCSAKNTLFNNQVAIVHGEYVLVSASTEAAE